MLSSYIIILTTSRVHSALQIQIDFYYCLLKAWFGIMSILLYFFFFFNNEHISCNLARLNYSVLWTKSTFEFLLVSTLDWKRHSSKRRGAWAWERRRATLNPEQSAPACPRSRQPSFCPGSAACLLGWLLSSALLGAADKPLCSAMSPLNALTSDVPLTWGHLDPETETDAGVWRHSVLSWR